MGSVFMILTYDEAKNKADNPTWFSFFYKREEIASDEEVNQINSVVKVVGEDKLHEYFQIKEDMLLQKEYVEDLMWYLNEIKEGRTPQLD